MKALEEKYNFFNYKEYSTFWILFRTKYLSEASTIILDSVLPGEKKLLSSAQYFIYRIDAEPSSRGVRNKYMMNTCSC